MLWDAMVVRFGPFEVDEPARTLRKRGIRIKLRQQSFDILAALLARPGEVVTREELRRRLWGETTFVDFENGLDSAVKRLRSALGDSAGDPLYIETVPRVGYRFAGRAAPGEGEGGRGRRLLVLPFTNLSGNAAEDYLSDGLTEEITGQLAALDSSLAVVARTSAMHYKGTRKGIGAIAGELDLDYVLEGSVRRSDGRVRVSAQLIDARRETHLWANHFEGELKDFLDFHCEIAQAVAREMRLSIARPAPASVGPEAYEFYLRAISQRGQFTPSSLGEAAQLFERAIAREPGFAKAWARLAIVCAHMAFWSFAPKEEAYPKAEHAARRAIELDDRLSDAHHALGVVYWFRYWDLEGCERELRHAMALNPNDPITSVMWFEFLGSIKADFAQAAAEVDRVLELDPLSAATYAHGAWVHYWGRQFPRAIHQCRRALEMDTRCLPAYFVLGLALLAEGRLEESVETFEKAAGLHGDSLSISYLASACGSAGKRDRAEELLGQLMTRPSLPPSLIAAVHLGLDDRESALDWLERGLAERDNHLLMLPVSPRWDSLRGEPRFVELLRKLPTAKRGG